MNPLNERVFLWRNSAKMTGELFKYCLTSNKFILTLTGNYLFYQYLHKADFAK